MELDSILDILHTWDILCTSESILESENNLCGNLWNKVDVIMTYSETSLLDSIFNTRAIKRDKLIIALADGVQGHTTTWLENKEEKWKVFAMVKKSTKHNILCP
jgi:hypothetical protein